MEKGSGSDASRLPARWQGVKNEKQPSRRQATVLRQLVELIPSYLVAKLARAHGVDRQARTFSPRSHMSWRCSTRNWRMHSA
jgi:hypothetical protein